MRTGIESNNKSRENRRVEKGGSGHKGGEKRGKDVGTKLSDRIQ